MTEPTPDGVPCRHCGEPIFWDEICWVHHNGFADCGLEIKATVQESISQIAGLYFDPEMKVQGPYAGKTALPMGEWS